MSSRSAHVQLGDIPQTLDPAKAEGEFRQHDGVVTVMMKLPLQGFALQRYDRGVKLWRVAPHTAKDQLVCLWGAPSPVYKGGEEDAGWPLGRAPRRGILLGLGSASRTPHLGAPP